MWTFVWTWPSIDQQFGVLIDNQNNSLAETSPINEHTPVAMYNI